jgi:hypothetical protein
MDIKTGVEVMNTGTLASEGTLSTKNVSAHVYPGSGTPEDPFLVCGYALFKGGNSLISFVGRLVRE